MRDRVTELREYGMVFLGPYCVVEGCLLKRKPGGQWEVKELYTTNLRHGLYSSYKTVTIIHSTGSCMGDK